MASNNSSGVDCLDEFRQPKLVGVISFTVFLCVISILGNCLVIAIIFLFKKHKYMTQRLIFYLAFSTLANAVIGLLSVVRYWADVSESLMHYCEAMGFLHQVVSPWAILATTCILVDVFIRVTRNISTVRYEWLYLAFVFLSPLLLTSWVPLVFDAYGPEGSYCWIRSKNWSDCSDFVTGVVLQFTLFYIPQFLCMLLSLILLLASMTIMHKQSKQWVGRFEPDVLVKKKAMKAELKRLLIYPVVILLTQAMWMVVDVYNLVGKDINSVKVATWYIGNFVYYSRGIAIAVMFTLDPKTMKRLNCREIRSALRSWCNKYETISEYPVLDSQTATDSLR